MISIIVAMDKNRAIGRQGGLPWRLSSDLARFKQITSGHPVIMGRKTLESIGRPLPRRTNIVVTRNEQWRAEGVIAVTDLRGSLVMAGKSDGGSEIFVIGGGEIFREAMNFVDKLYVTEVMTEVADADAFFPEIDAGVWREVSREHHERDEKNEFDCDFVIYERRQK